MEDRPSHQQARGRGLCTGPLMLILAIGRRLTRTSEEARGNARRLSVEVERNHKLSRSSAVECRNGRRDDFHGDFGVSSVRQSDTQPRYAPRALRVVVDHALDDQGRRCGGWC